MLPHLLRHPKYGEFYKSHARGDFIILDNGEAEGVRVEPPELFELAYEFGVNEIVVPDSLGNFHQSVNLAMQFQPLAELHPGFQYMAVVQGGNLPEVVACLNAYSHLDYITTIGIPRILANTINRTARYDLATIIQEDPEYQRFQIHFLGASEWKKEPVLLAETFARGMDTSLPVVMGLEAANIKTDPYMKRQEDYFDRCANAIQDRWIDHNIDVFLSWCE